MLMNLNKFKNVLKDRKKSGEEINDSEENERLLVDDIRSKWETSRIAKQKKVDIWDDCINAYNSDYFKDSSRPDYKSEEISNFIFSTIETIKPVMIDNNPKMIILPKSQKGMEVVDKLQGMFDNEWTRANMETKLIQAITIALQIGTAIIFVPWDSKDENGLGNVTPKLINPYNIFPDPMATSMDDAEYIIYATYKHINILKQLYPNKSDKITSNSINYSELVGYGSDTSNVKNQVLVLECYMRDYTTVDIEEEDEDGNVVKKRKPKFPKGRVVTCCPEINLLLSDKQLPYIDGKFPFELLKCYDIPFEFWGRSEIEQLLSPQEYINDLTNQIIDNAKLTANMPWIIDKNSGIGKGQLTNRPGLVIRKNPGTQVERKQPPQMPVYVQEMIEILKRDIEIISGVHDVTQGRKPGSVTAANAILALQEAAQARIRLKVKLMENTLSKVGYMWYNRIKQFWVTTRFVRTFNQDNKIEFVEITPEDLEEDIDFIIEAGSTMPTNKNAMLDLMIRLSQTRAEDGLPMVDRDTVLAYTNVPDKKKITKRFADLTGQNEAKQKEAEQQALAQQQAMQQQQVAQQQEQQMQQAALEIAKNEHSAQMEQVSGTNTEITDAQIEAIMLELMKDPQALQQFIAQLQNGQTPMGL